MSEKLILISSPQSMSSVIESYSQNRKEIESPLTHNLETTFNFSILDYDLSLELKHLNCEILIIHDEQDQEIPVSNALKLKAANKKSNLFLTNGSGHDKILISREMLRSVNNFLLV